MRRVRGIRLDREAAVPLDSRLVLSLQGQSKVRLLVQPGPPTQRAGHVPPLEFERAHGRQVTPAQQPVARRTGPC